MCQFKTALVTAPGVGAGGCATCRCQAGATGVTAAAAAEALRQMPPELLERYLAPARSLSPLSLDQVEYPAPVEAAAVRSMELDSDCQLDSNNNDDARSRGVGILKTARSLPCEKRHVQFADELGESLTEVRLFESEPCTPTKVQPPLDLLLQLHFQHPTAELALRALLSPDCSIHLSGIHLDPAGAGVSLSGFALVKNLGFQKRVFVRISADSWRSFADLEADYAGSLDEQRDAFEFELRCEIEEVDFEFCVCLEAEGHGQLWDSNGGQNYQVSLVKPRRAVFSLWGDDEDDD